MSTNQQLESFRKTLVELGPRQKEVMDLLTASPGGLSAWQITDRTKRMVHAVRPRVTELVEKGVVRQSGERWEERTQRHEAVWVASIPADGNQLLLA